MFRFPTGGRDLVPAVLFVFRLAHYAMDGAEPGFRCSFRRRGKARSRYGVVTASAPGMAGKKATQGQPTALEQTVFPERFQRILRACRSIPAGRRRERGDAVLVKLNEKDEREQNDLPQRLPKRVSA